jgi:hypothetical protein
MAVEYRYYFILKNQDQADFNNDFGLPASDDQIFDSDGFLSSEDSILKLQDLLRLNYQLKYTSSIYYKNQVIEEKKPEDGEERRYNSGMTLLNFECWILNSYIIYKRSNIGK